MANKIANLYQSACGKLRVSRMGSLTMLVVDGQGLALCTTADFSVAEKWAKSKQPGPNATIDMGKIVEKIDVMIVRPGTTFASTRGSTKPLEAIVKGMKAAGMDTKEFSLPPELKEADKVVDQVLVAMEAAKKKAAAADGEVATPAPASNQTTMVMPAVPPMAEPDEPAANVFDFRNPGTKS